jgi:hypothetical protein
MSERDYFRSLHPETREFYISKLVSRQISLNKKVDELRTEVQTVIAIEESKNEIHKEKKIETANKSTQTEENE